ncbi:MAG: hypothetical protein HC893_02795 [Chloroflexaceae bacterium]|nr:hypothetical protein [Chloroflexaceae bacterium]
MVTRAGFDDVAFAAHDAMIDPAINLLQNGSFEAAGEADDRALAWDRFGDWINRETDWSPVVEGGSVMGYHHFRVSGGDSSGGGSVAQNTSTPTTAPERTNTPTLPPFDTPVPVTPSNTPTPLPTVQSNFLACLPDVAT